MYYRKNEKADSPYDYHVNYKPIKREIISYNISLFRHNVVKEFLNIDRYIYESFVLFNQEIMFEYIITKEDFDLNLHHLYDWIAESYYFDGWKDSDNVWTYRQKLLDMMSSADFKTKREITKTYLKTRKFNTLRMDGVLDNMLHCYFDFKHLLPTQKELDYSFKDYNDLKSQRDFLTMDKIYDRLKEV